MFRIQRGFVVFSLAALCCLTAFTAQGRAWDWGWSFKPPKASFAPNTPCYGYYPTQWRAFPPECAHVHTTVVEEAPIVMPAQQEAQPMPLPMPMQDTPATSSPGVRRSIPNIHQGTTPISSPYSQTSQRYPNALYQPRR